MILRNHNPNMLISIKMHQGDQYSANIPLNIPRMKPDAVGGDLRQRLFLGRRGVKPNLTMHIRLGRCHCLPQTSVTTGQFFREATQDSGEFGGLPRVRQLGGMESDIAENAAIQSLTVKVPNYEYADQPSQGEKTKSKLSVMPVPQEQNDPPNREEHANGQDGVKNARMRNNDECKQNQGTDQGPSESTMSPVLFHGSTVHLPPPEESTVAS